ncbi:redoxin domain-containing protein [Alicyclobacillus sp. SO9]|nr:redoxin domain-containing protein [Alicyclobacillus sp. SO9]
MVLSSTYPSQGCVSQGDAAPAFTADAFAKGKQREVKLEDYRGKWVVLVFYSSDFTFV